MLKKIGKIALMAAAVLAYGNESKATAIVSDNLIYNGSGEIYGPSGWMDGWTVSGMSVSGYGNWGVGRPTPDAGNVFFWGGYSGSATAAQSIDVSAWSDAIDMGTTGADLSGYFGGYGSQNDNTTLYASFRDEAGSLLGQWNVGSVLAGQRGYRTGMVFESVFNYIPELTRSVDILFTARRYSGSDNDGYSDNLSFVIHGEQNVVPEPASLGLFGAGLAGLAWVRRRNKTA
ncbi:PEP-CTERM sorting domain-containing protein [Magnetospira sp. QH-2]|uniref:PEP-CTERM sorting domain-containing protein n=1 Tax=Magnetospira sp. (strain QH-2) TaxID=1288970 RepID=UPI0003E80BCF|nr:PEP-CTERM sorting domain-containing protein [Magnetospira sp. QH-2]CCQ73337.1 Conserved exported protein of unknown function [Magnetospira sp. QH-2]